MKNYPVPRNEKRRLQALYDYNILDTLSEVEYDCITKIATQICNAPVSLITLLDKDRQWFKSHEGIDMQQTPREYSFCNYTIIGENRIMVVTDLRADERFAHNPLVAGAPNAVFYAGAQLVTPKGLVLGSICVLDGKPRELDEEQKNALMALAKQVMNTMELRKKNIDLKLAEQRLKSTNKSLKEFAHIVSHDMKTPLANISMLARSFKNAYCETMEEGSNEFLDLIDQSAKELTVFLDRILIQSEKIAAVKNKIKPVDTKVLVNRTLNLIAAPKEISIHVNGKFPKLTIDEISLQQVFQNLIINAIKYNDKKKPVISINSSSEKDHHYFTISDNGSGIEEKYLETIFRKKQTLNKTDRYGNKGTGKGLAKVKNLVEIMGGKISVNSTLKKGSDFTISIPLLNGPAA